MSKYRRIGVWGSTSLQAGQLGDWCVCVCVKMLVPCD